MRRGFTSRGVAQGEVARYISASDLGLVILPDVLSAQGRVTLKEFEHWADSSLRRRLRLHSGRGDSDPRCRPPERPGRYPGPLAKIEEGYDVVSGWRVKRKDPFLTRRLLSLMANFLISKVTGVSLHDYGCSLKAYRREVIEGIDLYQEEVC